MSKRKARARREDPRTWTREEAWQRYKERYLTALRAARRRHEAHRATSPYFGAIERLYR
jgi:hypothetical protein